MNYPIVVLSIREKERETAEAIREFTALEFLCCADGDLYGGRCEHNPDGNYKSCSSGSVKYHIDYW